MVPRAAVPCFMVRLMFVFSLYICAGRLLCISALNSVYQNYNYNDPFVRVDIANSGKIIISFSHFLPRYELLPEKRFLVYPKLPKASGSIYLQKRVATLKPDLHIFGHTHIGWDMTLDGIRYMQVYIISCLSFPRC